MGTAHWELQGNSICLRTSSGSVTFASAMEVFQAEFGDLREVHGEAVQSPARDLPQLRFSRFPAEPVIRATETATGLRVGIGVVAGGRFVEVREGDDQVVVDSQWFPIQANTLSEASAWLRNIGASPGAEASVGALIALRTRGDVPVKVLDEVRATSESMAAARSSSAGAIKGLEATLYPYQVAGVAFLELIAEQDVGCILADEMGLGKTLQVIGLLQAEKNSGRGPSLVVSPATLLENWRRELHHFAPTLSVYIHAGAERAGVAAQLTGSDVTVVSYDTAVRDEPLLAQVKWNVIALDEAQNIKNPDSKRASCVKRLPRRVSIAVTGTPLENRLEDLWSVTDFALPAFLGNLGNFQREFSEGLVDATRVGKLVAPVLLRRRVADVAKDLPEKIEVPQPLRLSDRMAEGYERVRQDVLREYGPTAGLVATTKLRLFCAHPSIVGANWQGDPSFDMPKYERLLEILEEVFLGGEKALVFSSFQDIADVLVSDLPRHFPEGFFGVIDGRLPVPRRQPLLDDFFAHAGYGALLLNPKAAGAGLNITAANHVVHYNPEWNPAVTDQATARAYRRKQDRPVTVHYLYFIDTVEEVMMDRAAYKRRLASEAVTGHAGEVDPIEIARALQISPLHN